MPINPDLALTKRVAINAAEMASDALKLSDPSQVSALLEQLTTTTVRYCDLLHAIGIALSVQADAARSSLGSTRAEAISTVAAAAAIIAQTIETTDLPPPGDLH